VLGCGTLRCTTGGGEIEKKREEGEEGEEEAKRIDVLLYTQICIP
jgi:hypothetical protein